MNTLAGFIVKEFRHILRDTRSLLILFGMPVIMLILFGFAIRNEAEEVAIGVLDHSKDKETAQIIHAMDASGNFEVVKFLQSEKEIEDAFQEGEIKEVVIFERNFGRKLERTGEANVELVTDASDPNLAQNASHYARMMLLDFQRQWNQGESGLAGITANTDMQFNPRLRSVNMFVPGLIAVILMLISALMTSISIAREKEMGSMELLLVSPLRSLHIILGKVLPYMVLSMINVITILILSMLVFDIPFRGSVLLFFIESLIFIVTALALGVMISTVSNNQQTAMMMALAGLLLPTVMLSGFIFPISSMPLPLQWFSAIVPARWFLVIVKGIMLKGIGIEVLWRETLILSSMTVLLIGMSMWSFSTRLER